MTTPRVMQPVSAALAPVGLREALEAACRLVARDHHVAFRGRVWRHEEHYLAQFEVDGLEEMWRWQPGEPVFVREGGI